MSGTEKAYFAAGCFWGVEAKFRKVNGVRATAVGYQGGNTINPTYEQVCYEDTGHAESVCVEYDPSVVSYGDLLNIFWQLHDPTTLNRQGPDVGSQYRSAVFYLGEDQKAQAEDLKVKLDQSGLFRSPIVTEITQAPDFFLAEEYHQQYLEKRGH